MTSGPRKCQNIKRITTMAVFVTAAMLAHLSPALAAGAGVTDAGYSNIDRDAEPSAPLCLFQDVNAPGQATIITLSNLGTFNSNPDPVRTTARFEATESFYFGPGGTFSDSLCTIPTALDSDGGITGTLTVAAHVECGPTTATYNRVGTQYTIRTTTPSTCTDKRPNPDTTETSNLTFTGTQLACQRGVADPCGGGSQSQEFTGTYTQGP